ncbi:MAG TPA: three-Cys-motif partner protein TcmP [Ignavibacteriaceae bacterium]|nr:three-Cys-motif partner protein TcmP [Ignavibacteriaceae bacterium]
MSKISIVKEPTGEWGGKWTEKKLDAFSKYVWSYLTIMKQNPYWKTIYFDGFAGSGSRKKEKSELFTQLKLTAEDERVYKSSAERVLSIKDDLIFDYYYFIDTKKTSIKKLEARLKPLEMSRGKSLAFRTGNANKWLIELATVLKTKKYSALIFLDPFGMQIDWDSIEYLKGTRSDIWILVPTGVIVNRLLDKKGELKFLKKLQSFFGLSEDQIRKEFYETKVEDTLFGETDITRKVLQPIEKISYLYLKRLNTIWDYTISKPLRLDNNHGFPIFHFAFASNNRNAVKIANQIIKGV